MVQYGTVQHSTVWYGMVRYSHDGLKYVHRSVVTEGVGLILCGKSFRWHCVALLLEFDVNRTQIMSLIFIFISYFHFLLLFLIFITFFCCLFWLLVFVVYCLLLIFIFIAASQRTKDRSLLSLVRLSSYLTTFVLIISVSSVSLTCAQGSTPLYCVFHSLLFIQLTECIVIVCSYLDLTELYLT